MGRSISGSTFYVISVIIHEKFTFIKYDWDTIGTDFTRMVMRFELDEFIPCSCNSSFLTHVPKIHDHVDVKDYRPISLIGCQYKLIAKVLANRLMKVIHSMVSEVHTAYVKGRQIIDGEWNYFLGFQEEWAYFHHESGLWKSVWFSQLELLGTHHGANGFLSKWRKWINGCLDSSFGSVLVNGSPTKEFKIQKGLRQHDLLSRFIFIIAVEALHISLQEAKLKLFLKELKSVIIKLTSLTYNLRMMHLYWVLGLSKMQRTYVASLDVFNCRRVWKLTFWRANFLELVLQMLKSKTLPSSLSSNLPHFLAPTLVSHWALTWIKVSIGVVSLINF